MSTVPQSTWPVLYSVPMGKDVQYMLYTDEGLPVTYVNKPAQQMAHLK